MYLDFRISGFQDFRFQISDVRFQDFRFQDFRFQISRFVTMTCDYDYGHLGLGARKSTLWVSLVMVMVSGHGQ